MESTVLTILKAEKESFAKAAALCDIKVNFFTDEREDRFMRMEVEEISNQMMYYFMITFYNQKSFDKCEPKSWVAKA